MVHKPTGNVAVGLHSVRCAVTSVCVFSSVAHHVALLRTVTVCVALILSLTQGPWCGQKVFAELWAWDLAGCWLTVGLNSVGSPTQPQNQRTPLSHRSPRCPPVTHNKYPEDTRKPLRFEPDPRCQEDPSCSEFFFHSALKRCITIIVFSMKSPHKNKNVRPFQDSFTVTVSRLTAAYYGSQVYFYIVHDYEDTEQQLWHHKHASLPCRAESITVLSDTETLDLFIDSLIVWLVIYINLFL